MTNTLKQEISGLSRFLRNNAPEAAVILTSTLALTLNRYHRIHSEWLSALIYYAALPLLVILLMRKKPLDFGMGFGAPRIWLVHVLVICAASAAVLYAASFMPSLQSYYRQADFHFIRFFLTSCASLSASEFLYRGFLLFGLKEKFKEGSILLQMVPFALLHLGKPELETLSTLLTGILFGYTAYRGKSFWPAFIIHLFINVFFITLVNNKTPVAGG